MSVDRDTDGSASRRAGARRTALVLGLTALGLYVMFILKGVVGS